MNTGKKDTVPQFSADYRSAYPKKPKAENMHPKQARRPASKPARPPKQRPHPPEKKAKAQHRTVKPPADPVGQGNGDTEVDDFLPAEEHTDDERILSKWDDGTEDAEPKAEIRPKRHGRYRYGIFAGTLVLLLALVGVGYIAMTIGTRIDGILTDDSKLRAYDKSLTVVVAQDPQPFASPDKADPGFVLNASLWRTMTENASSHTSYDNAGRAIVPLGDVANACHELFGSNCSLQPKKPAQETFYDYDSAKMQFHVALYSLDSTYEPYTESAKKDGDSTVLRVGYVPPSDATRTQSAVSSATPKPVKYMEYVMKTDPSTKKEYIYAIRKVS